MNLVEIIERIKQAAGVSTDGEVASLLNMKRSTLAERKRNNSIPYDCIARFSEQRSVSIDWLLYGESADPHQIKKYHREKMGLPIKDSGLDSRPTQPAANPVDYLVEGVKEILNSKDQVLIRALTLNLAAFQSAAQKQDDTEQRLTRLEDKFIEINKKLSRVLKVLDSIKAGAKLARKDSAV